ncbi:50S ribosomal protein L25/general stress protein Ctc [Kaistia dalseonensis]|uniref:Large ribosomal subunit protein bL25 n=1 Tax=Kaistia dalseonensis TaxID=410840 RepID=A0ABU0H653_9HYPH|nr:50S ribosomal protein L25/general stress protein Ctc [Kaistia dalseonensis]MCX5495191.1 50S ribosomal protein L25/general stress protein Ctc [Kaistia dalseonensis]MDQ0437776.1 large subunit ribosomal protein L25 [Kaistia dalseonensis]
MSTAYELTASVRNRVGKGAARASRREGKIPAVIYGDKQAPLAIELSHKDIFLKLHAGGFLTTIATIDVDGQKIRVLPRDYALHPVTDQPIHVDFLRISAHSTLHVEIPVQFINEDKSPGLKAGGSLNIVRHEIEVNAPVDAIPERITVDLASAEIGDSIHISSVQLPAGVTPVISERDFTIATIVAPVALTAEEVAAAAAAAAAPTGKPGAKAPAKAPAAAPAKGK